MKNALALTLALTAAAAAAPASSADLVLYPGATKLPRQMSTSIAFCGTKMTVVGYRLPDVNAQTVAAWYKSRIPGAITVTTPKANSIGIEVLAPDGHAAAVITQMRYDPGLASAAKSIGADRAGLGIATYDPPLSRDMIELIAAVAHGDSSARAKMKAHCPGGSE